MEKTTYADLSPKYKEVLDKAEQAMLNGYTPYSHFYVGASVLTKSGKIYAGTNIETASYVAICAEQAAISRAVTDGEYSYEAIAVICGWDSKDVNEIAGPCGTCRQLIYEFSEVADKDIEIINSTTDKKVIIIATISELHPISFGPIATKADISRYQTE